MDYAPFTQKRCIFILKKMIVLSKSQKLEPKNWTKYFRWELKHEKNLEKLWEMFFIILESLDQFSIHLTLQCWNEIYNMFPKRNTSMEQYLHFSWIQIILLKSFNHNNFALKKLAIHTILDLDFKVYSNFFPIDFLCDTLLNNINEPKFYYDTKPEFIGEKISKFYQNYFGSQSHEENQTLFKFLIKGLAEIPSVGSLTLLYHLKMMLSLDHPKIMNDECLSYVFTLIDNAFHTRVLWLDLKMQYYIFEIVFKLCEPGKEGLIHFSKILTSFNDLVLEKKVIEQGSKWLLQCKDLNIFFKEQIDIFIKETDLEKSMMISKRISKLFMFLSYKDFEDLFKNLYSEKMNSPKILYFISHLMEITKLDCKFFYSLI